MNNFIAFLKGNGVNNPTQLWDVAAGATEILPGQPAIRSTTKYVVAAPDASPVVGTHIYMGHASGTSLQNSPLAFPVIPTTPVDTQVNLYIPMQEQILILPAKLPSAIATQAEYDALVNGVVLFDLTSGIYTIDTASLNSSANNGLYVMPLDVTVYPGMVAFIVRQSVTFLA